MSAPNWNKFRADLLAWYRPDRRPMPWKDIKDPYHIWLSEIILQQTRVAQGWPYYERFVAAYPTVVDLARAEDDAVMKLWEGLGYYSRARNLLKAARMVANDLGGIFPDTYQGLRALPGVGPYTAAAVASFAFDRRVAVLDGNVFRILARFADDPTPIDLSRSRKHYDALAEKALGDASARRFNQAIMDFGALVCTPRNAGCGHCPLAANCLARRHEAVYERPVKEKKLKRRTRYFHYLVVEGGHQRTIIEQRSAKDIWQTLYQFPLVATEVEALTTADLATLPDWPGWLPAGELDFVRRSPPRKQQLTHQTIVAVFHHFRWARMPTEVPGSLVIENKLLVNYAFPGVIAKYLAEKSLLLDLF